MKEIIIEGKKYLISNGKWYDLSFLELPLNKVNELQLKYYGSLDLNVLEDKELFKIADSYIKSKNYTKAIEIYEKLYLKFPNIDEKENLLPSLINLYVQNNEPSKGINLFNKAKEQYSLKLSNPELYIELSLAYLEMGEKQYAKKIIGKAYAMGDRSEKLKNVYSKF